MLQRQTVRSGNRILDALPDDASKRLEGALSPVNLRLATVLWEPGQRVEAVYFPVEGVISLVTPLEGGGSVEVATIGNEGIVGVPTVLGGGLATLRAVAQVSGWSLRMELPAFHHELRRGGAFNSLVQNYVPALFSQIAQAAGCNRLHSNEERLSRWLLMSHDRVGADRFEITQEFLAQMLGSRRATVTVSAGILQKAGLISYHRGHMVIVDRERLEAASCECYGVIKRELDEVIERALRSAWEQPEASPA